MTILQIKASVTPKLMTIPGVVGVGIQKGKIAVYIKKRTAETLSAIPLTIGGYGVKIVESGEFFAFQDRTGKWRPALGGVSIGHYAITAGTLATRIIDNETGKRVILSNNHILANKDSFQNSRANKGDAIYQPGSYDGGSSADTIANLERWVKLDEIGINKVDCAIATPINDADLSDEILEIGVVDGITDVIEGMVVRKSGRTTGLTIGNVIDANLTVDVNYGWQFVARFIDCIYTTENMGDGGDSGSLFVADNKAVGLLFAGNSAGNIIACKISNVVNELNVNFAPPIDHTLKLTKEGYYDYEEQFSIAEGETKDFDITLTPIEIPPEEKKFPYWMLLFAPILIIPFIKKKK